MLGGYGRTLGWRTPRGCSQVLWPHRALGVQAVWSGKWLARRGALAGCLPRRRGQCAYPATVPGRKNGHRPREDGWYTWWWCALGVAGYQRQLALCFVVPSDGAQSGRGCVRAAHSVEHPKPRRSSHCVGLVVQFASKPQEQGQDLSARSRGSADHGQHPDPQRHIGTSRAEADGLHPFAAPRRLPGDLRSDGRRGCCRSRWA